MMLDSAAFPIMTRWPASDPTKIQLYSLPTPNGIKASTMLEETGLPYEAHRISFGDDDQRTPEFLSLNPNNKIPAIIDPDGPDGPMGLWESGAILLYLAEKTGKLLPKSPSARYETIQWLMWQMGGVGPMFGQFGHFWKIAKDKVTDDYPENRYADETRRLLGVLEKRLDGRDWIMGEDYTIADVATWPWVRTLGGFYEAGDRLKLGEFPRVGAWLARAEARPASRIGIETP
jgi:GSH-dependent disulfide-bond oxidoreductase